MNSVAVSARHLDKHELAAYSPALGKLVAARRRVGILTILVVMGTYLGFFALVAFERPWMASPLTGFGSIAFLVMALMFVVAWVITLLYLRHAQRSIAPLEAAARGAFLTQMNNATLEDSSK